MSLVSTFSLNLKNHFSSLSLKKISEGFFSEKEELKSMMKAILLSHDKKLFTETSNFDISLEIKEGDVYLNIHNISSDIFVSEKLLAHKEIQVISVLRDIFFSHHVSNSVLSGSEAYIHHILENASLLSIEDENLNPLGRVMIQGGHNISALEKDHHYQVGFHIGSHNLEIITGSGQGAMKSPFKGAILAYGLNHTNSKKLIGLTEKKLLKNEMANPYNNHLVIFPDIEKRMEAFLRLSKGGLILPGGVGTLEEILIFLSIRLNDQNKNFYYPLYFVEPDHLNYFEEIFKFLSLCLNKDVQKLSDIKYFKTDPSKRRGQNSIYECIAAFHKDLNEAKQKNLEVYKKEKWIYSNLWNQYLFFPEQFKNAPLMDSNYFESISLSEGLPTQEILWNIRCVCYLIIEATVRNPSPSWRTSPIKIKGDKSITGALDKLIDRFISEKRLGSNPVKPYVFS